MGGLRQEVMVMATWVNVFPIFSFNGSHKRGVVGAPRRSSPT
jgi:hypothetical protein